MSEDTDKKRRFGGWYAAAAIITALGGFGGLVSFLNYLDKDPVPPIKPPPEVETLPFGKRIAIKTTKGSYVLAVNGGGLVDDAVRTDSWEIGPYETFVLEKQPQGKVAFKTAKDYYLGAVSGGNRTDDVIRTDATQVGPWETFRLDPLGDGAYAIRTDNGRYLVAMSGGDRGSEAFHSDAEKVGPWEMFRIVVVN